MLAIVFGGGGLAAAAPAWQPGDDAVQEPPAAAAGDLRTLDDPVHDAQVRYAEARLRLAELDLERASAVNERAHDAIGERELGRLRTHVATLQRHVAIAREHPRTAARQASIAAAEAACADARGDLEAAERVNDRTAGSVSEINVRRLRARVELADARLELCRNPDYELSLLAELEWNIEQLTADVIDLRHRVEADAMADAGQRR